MDTTMQAKLDALVEQEHVQGYRILEVPKSVQTALKEARQLDPAIPHFSKLRIAKLTPKKRASVSEAVLAQYHADLKNKSILSKANIRELNIDRGQWSVAKEKRIKELQDSSTKLLYDLTLEGLDKEPEWRKQLNESSIKYLEALQASEKHPDEKEYLAGIFWRWVAYTPELQEAYTTEYAELQKLESYSLDWDLARLYETSPTAEAAEYLATIDDLQAKLERYKKLFVERQELIRLLTEEARMYAESVESRRDNAEEMARMYYGLTALNDTEQVVGPVTPSLDGFWELPDDFISWLLEESYLFYNNIPQAIRGNLDDWGFTVVGRESGQSPPSVESPDPQASSSVTELAEVTE